MSHPAQDSRNTQQLVDASVQEIQLELIRRTQFNEFDGKRVVASLMEHRNLWRSVMLDREGIRSGDGLPGLELVKLRDLPQNIWNADTLFILCATPGDARKLEKIIEDEEWGGIATVYENPKAVNSALGGSDDRAIITVWWD